MENLRVNPSQTIIEQILENVRNAKRGDDITTALDKLAMAQSKEEDADNIDAICLTFNDVKAHLDAVSSELRMLQVQYGVDVNSPTHYMHDVHAAADGIMYHIGKVRTAVDMQLMEYK